MSVSRVGDRSRRRKGGPRRALDDAMRDAVPDAQPKAPIKRMREEDEPAAENDEEDD
jgi:hypothetical protein